MPNNNGLDLALAAARPQAPPLMVAAPMNDVHLVSLIAAKRPDIPPVEAVEWAVDIVVEAVVQTAHGKLEAAIKARLALRGE